ncbi:TIGR04540 family protein [Brevibacillus agri]|uniref:TIGR04540 family protein n=1 Tax=Brevibacillus agri TaxID=51101 RepID=UPI0025B71834|nr:TIGR04540 family protein [Brevibacillus agri]MDN4095594.1 TIGR04540 family protein [Brevibacillus agri]
MFDLEIKLFYKTQRELASALNGIVDSYWENVLNEEDLIKNVLEIYANNTKKILKHNEFTTILKQQCGKRRLEVIGRILHMNGLLQDEQSVV